MGFRSDLTTLSFTVSFADAIDATERFVELPACDADGYLVARKPGPAN